MSRYASIEKAASDALQEVRGLGPATSKNDVTALTIMGGALAAIERMAHDAQHMVFDPKAARDLLGMEEHAFAQKFLNDAAFHAAIYVIIEQGIDFRAKLEGRR